MYVYYKPNTLSSTTAAALTLTVCLYTYYTDKLKYIMNRVNTVFRFFL